VLIRNAIGDSGAGKSPGPSVLVAPGWPGQVRGGEGLRNRRWRWRCDGGSIRKWRRLPDTSVWQPSTYRTRPKGLEPSTFGSTVF